jgi:hypothetical protein
MPLRGKRCVKMLVQFTVTVLHSNVIQRKRCVATYAYNLWIFLKELLTDSDFLKPKGQTWKRYNHLMEMNLPLT